MPVLIAVPKESVPGERRVAINPEVAKKFAKLGASIVVESGLGATAGFTDKDLGEATCESSTAATLAKGDVVFKVQSPTQAEIDALKPGAVLVAFMQPGKNPERVRKLLEKKTTVLAVELIPRITRAQSMDALSSQAAVAGYQATLMAAQLCPKFFPMLTYAAGTVRPAKVLVIGAGVAGLQAIATARRLGALVSAYDVRTAVKEQIESLGAKFVMAVQGAEGSGGYARELTEDEKRLQAEALAKVVSESDVVISTAAIPGRPAPKIITVAMAHSMRPGSVIVDLAAETGGNCELTEPGRTVVKDGVTLHGPLNVPANMPVHASEMYAKNLFNLVSPFLKDGVLTLDFADEVIKGCTYLKDGQVAHEPSKQALGL
jgi:H+-translocating NAD(P) transhydrogenase subunit alpha